MTELVAEHPGGAEGAGGPAADAPPGPSDGDSIWGGTVNAVGGDGRQRWSRHFTAIAAAVSAAAAVLVGVVALTDDGGQATTPPVTAALSAAGAPASTALQGAPPVEAMVPLSNIELWLSATQVEPTTEIAAVLVNRGAVDAMFGAAAEIDHWD